MSAKPKLLGAEYQEIELSFMLVMVMIIVIVSLLRNDLSMHLYPIKLQK